MVKKPGTLWRSGTCSVSYQSLNSPASTFEKSIAAISTPFAMAFLLLPQLTDYDAAAAAPCIHWVNSVAGNPRPAGPKPKGVLFVPEARQKFDWRDPDVKGASRTVVPVISRPIPRTSLGSPAYRLAKDMHWQMMAPTLRVCARMQRKVEIR